MPRISLQKTGQGGQFQEGGESNSKFKGSWRFLSQETNLKLAHSGGSPGNFFVRKDETTDRGAYQKKRYGADNCVSEEGKTLSVEDGRGVLSMNKIL